VHSEQRIVSLIDNDTSMFIYLLKRVQQAAIVMLVISFIAFAIQDSLGDPTREMLGLNVSEAEREAFRDELGLNDPFLVQYGRFLGRALEGDLGQSLFFKEPALKVIFDKLPATLELVFGASIVIVGFSIPFGVYCAIRPKSYISKTIMAVSVLGISIPVFLIALLSVSYFSIYLGWLPSFGRGELTPMFGAWETGYLTADGLKHLILPCLSLSSLMLPLFIRLIRAEMVEVLGSEYVKFATAKGLPMKRVWFLHALKNTLLPVITVGGVQLGTMVAYTILTETVFQWPGMGFMFLEAINRSDTPLIVAYLIVVGGIFIIVNTLVDLVYGLINPTVRLAAK